MAESTTTVAGDQGTADAQPSSGTWPPDLADRHIKMLEESGISPAVATARGYRTIVDPVELQMRWRFSPKQAQGLPGLLVPIHNVNGDVPLAQLRPDKPRIDPRKGKPIKYETPDGAAMAIDVPPAIRANIADPAIPLVVTEGCKKADSAASRGVTCIALAGVWNWRGRNGVGGITALPDWESIALKGEDGPRKVYIAFDSDVTVKKEAYSALKRLKAFLENRGAEVLIITFREGANGAKVALDDFFSWQQGTPEALFDMASPSLPPAPERGGGERGASGGGNDEESPNHDAATIAEAILASKDCYYARDAGGDIYFYGWGTYNPEGDRDIRQKVKNWFIKSKIPEAWTSGTAREVVEFISVDCRPLWPRPPLDVINVKNGLVYWKEDKFPVHDLNHLSSVQLPVKFDRSATCPRWEKFVSEVFPEDAQDLAWEIAAWLMVPYLGIQKAIMLLGEGGNGKSTYLRGLIRFLGQRNVSTQPLQRLEHDRFAVSSLVGKLANICPDLPSTQLSATSVFKSITGGDVLLAERKYQRAFEFQPFARLVFSANRAPVTTDSSAAFFQRWVVVRFARSFRGTREEIPADVLDQQLADPAELSGLLNKALAVLPRLIEGGFTVSESMRQEAEEFRSTTDPVLVWLDANVIDKPDGWISKQDLRAAYNAEAAKKNQPGESDRAFTGALKRWRPDLKEGRRPWKWSRPSCWLGITLRSEEQNRQAAGEEADTGDDYWRR